MTAEFSRLIGVDKISSEIGSKNLVIKLVNYQPDDVDKVRADVENGLFTLTLLPKAGKKSPTKDQIDINYTGVSSDLVLLIGGSTDSDFPVLKTPDIKGAKIVHVGIKLLELQDDTLQILSFATTSSSTSELTAGLLKESEYQIDADVATNLLAGIENHSQNFQSTEVTVKTFEIFTELLKLGGLRFKKLPSATFPQGAIPTKPYTQQINQSVSKPVNQNPHITDRQMTQEEAEQEIEQEIPPSWSEPRIYTGTSVS